MCWLVQFHRFCRVGLVIPVIWVTTSLHLLSTGGLCAGPSFFWSTSTGMRHLGCPERQSGDMWLLRTLVWWHVCLKNCWRQQGSDSSDVQSSSLVTCGCSELTCWIHGSLCCFGFTIVLQLFYNCFPMVVQCTRWRRPLITGFRISIVDPQISIALVSATCP